MAQPLKHCEHLSCEHVPPTKEIQLWLARTQNYTCIGLYGVYTVFWAGKSPYKQSYTVQIGTRFWTTLNTIVRYWIELPQPRPVFALSGALCINKKRRAAHLKHASTYKDTHIHLLSHTHARTHTRAHTYTRTHKHTHSLSHLPQDDRGNCHHCYVAFLPTWRHTG